MIVNIRFYKTIMQHSHIICIICGFTDFNICLYTVSSFISYLLNVHFMAIMPLDPAPSHCCVHSVNIICLYNYHIVLFFFPLFFVHVRTIIKMMSQLWNHTESCSHRGVCHANSVVRAHKHADGRHIIGFVPWQF